MTSTAPIPIDPRLQDLLEGKPLKFPPPPEGREETPEEKKARTIPADWLERLAERPKRVVSVPVNISHAIIGGPLDLQYATFEAEVSIRDCEFPEGAGETVDFSFATFKRPATFEGSHFRKPANFRAAHSEADFEIMRASFANGSSFQDLHVDEVLDAQGASFGSVHFERIEVIKSAFFQTDAQGNRASFGGDAIFLAAHIQGQASFLGAEFRGAANFKSFQVGGSAFFQTDAQGNRASFGGDADFRGAHIEGQASFLGAEFRGAAIFDSFRVDGNAFFRPDAQGNRASFRGDANFRGARIQGHAVFLGAEFRGAASFDSFQVGGSAFFRTDAQGNRVTFFGPASFPVAILGGETQFTRADFKAAVDFNNAHFRGAAKFDSAEFATDGKATFIGARFERGAYFDSARFRGETDFTAAVAERDVRFFGAEFSGPASFREARFQVVFFGDPPAEETKRWRRHRGQEEDLSQGTVFGGPLDLRGFSYERIYVRLGDLFPRIRPFDRQPYAQLESALRKAGDDRRGHKVYLERRRQERKHKFRPRTLHLWLLDWLYKLGANYGVRPYPLVLYTLLFVLFGAVLFSQPGALELKKDGSTQAAPHIDPSGVSFWQGLGVSVHYFLPMDVPVGVDLQPKPGRVSVPLPVGKWKSAIRVSPSWYATIFLRVAGAILMGLGVAAITGLLRRIAS